MNTTKQHDRKGGEKDLLAGEAHHVCEEEHGEDQGDVPGGEGEC